MRHWRIALEDEVAERGNRRENKQVGVQFEQIAVDGQGHPFLHYCGIFSLVSPLSAMKLPTLKREGAYHSFA
jgi:hypothetical protein